MTKENKNTIKGVVGIMALSLLFAFGIIMFAIHATNDAKRSEHKRKLQIMKLEMEVEKLKQQGYMLERDTSNAME